MQIQIPNNWEPRAYQLPVLRYFDSGGTRAATIWHRRAGKDSCAINQTAKMAFQRVAVYWHLMPTQRQARKAIWNGVNPGTGQKFIDQAFPKEVRKRTRDDEMMIELINGSVWQLAGSDNYDGLVGSNVAGVVFSEWSLTNPRSWDYVRPILAENGGWAWFIYTPRGKNHGYDLYQMAEENPLWFHEVLTAKDTGAISAEIIEEERASGMSEEMIQQEYYCSFEGSVEGSYYSDLIRRAREDGRICSIPVESTVPVNTFWDLGLNDTTVIWFHQRVGKENRFIDYYETNGEGLQHYAQVLRDKAYYYGDHYLPHDVEVTELSTRKTRKQTLKDLGVQPIKTVPRVQDINEGIQTVRNVFNTCWFDEKRCKEGIRSLESYRKDYDEKNQTFRSRPLHDWASNGADAFRQFAQGYEADRAMKRPEKIIPKRAYIK